MYKKLFFLFLFYLCHSTLTYSQVFQLSPEFCHIYWPFVGSQYLTPTTGTDTWHVTNGPGQGFHLGGDHYADDWNFGSGPDDCGLPVLAPMDGTVIFAGTGVVSGYGKQVVLRSTTDNRFAFRVAHLNFISVTLSESVKAGAEIGRIGNTGTESCHAHCVLYKNIEQIYSGSTTGLSRLQEGNHLSLTDSNKDFAVPYFFDAVSSPGQLSLSEFLFVYATRPATTLLYALPNEYGTNQPFESEKNFAAKFKLKNLTSSPITIDDYGVSIRDMSNNHLFDLLNGSGITLNVNQESSLFDKRGYMLDTRLTNGNATQYKAQVVVQIGGVWQDLSVDGGSAVFTVNPRPSITNASLLKRPRSSASSDPNDAVIYYHQNGIKWRGTEQGLNGLFPNWENQFYVFPSNEVNLLSAPSSPSHNSTIPEVVNRNLLFQYGVDVYIIEPDPNNSNIMSSRLFQDESAFYSYYGLNSPALQNDPIQLTNEQFSWITSQYPIGTPITGPTDVDNENRDVPLGFQLYQNFPNPFNPVTTIEFSLSKAGQTSLRILNSLGQEVASLVSKELNAGSHVIQWDASNLPSGVYYCELRTEVDNNKGTRKLLLLR